MIMRRIVLVTKYHRIGYEPPRLLKRFAAWFTEYSAINVLMHRHEIEIGKSATDGTGTVHTRKNIMNRNCIMLLIWALDNSKLTGILNLLNPTSVANSYIMLRGFCRHMGRGLPICPG